MKYVLAQSSLEALPEYNKNYRGLNVFTMSELIRETGTDKRGNLQSGYVQIPLFCLLPEEREQIMNECTYVQAVISSRMNRISSLEWEITHKKELQEDNYETLKDLKQIHAEMDDPGDIKHLIVRARILQALRSEFPEMKTDLSNFDSVMLRYKRRYERRIKESRDNIKNWVSQPNQEDDFNDYIKKWVGCLMLHGASPIYKEYAWGDAYLENFYVLPGGSVLPLRSVQVGGFVAYIQIIMGHMPKFYYQDEVTFTNYLPSSARSYGYVPIDALVNKVAEQILFDRFAATRADGTKPPEKILAFGANNSLFGNMTGEIDLPMPKAEQKRIEEKLNTARKEAIATLSGVGTPVVIDLSRADTFAAQSQRQNQLLRDTALAFGMTNMEINLAGGEFTSGKECYSEDTETLTDKGWRSLGEITKEEKIACYDPEDGQLKYYNPKRLCVYYHEGEMIHFKNSIIDILVTDKHKMYMAQNRKKENWIKIEAKYLKTYACKNYFTNKSKWNSDKEIKEFVIGEHKTRMMEQPNIFNGDDFIEFLGYWISEGCIWNRIDKYNYESKVIELSQKKDGFIEKIDNNIKRLGVIHSRRETKQGVIKWVIYHHGLYDYLKDTIGKYQHERIIPDNLKILSQRQLKILFDALMHGDGHIAKIKTNGYYCSTSRQLREDVSEIMIKLEMSISTNEVYPGGKRKPLYRVAFAKRNGMQIFSSDIKKVYYKGYVYCFETETGLYYTRRNGKITIQGNTSETQQEIEEGKGTKPIIDKIRQILNRDIMPYRWGDQWIFEYSKSLNEFDQAKLDALKMQTNTYSADQVREERGDKPMLQPGSDQLPNQQGGGQSQGASPFAPVYTQAVQ